MSALQPALTCLVVFIGNCGFWLFCFNRCNAAGLERNLTKRLEKLIVFVCFAIPGLILYVDATEMAQWFSLGNQWWPSSTSLFIPWGIFCLLSTVLLGPSWLESRRWMWPPHQLLETQAKRFQVEQHIDGLSTGDWKTAMLNRIPGNEITQLEVNRKSLQIGRSLQGIDGLEIAHISDLHFTGQLSIKHYHFVVERVLEMEADLIVITGDIIDYAHCLEWIEPLLGRLHAPLGCVYLLGNHDQRIANISEVTDRLDRLGHFDLGAANQLLQTSTGGHVFLTGNERPWFERHSTKTHNVQTVLKATDDSLTPESTTPSPRAQGAIPADALRLGLSHTPDNIGWARDEQLDLLLAGHTHGGQVRLPGIGPLVSPSRFGSRFASGVFYRDPVLMHVSRGLSGTHPFRYRCLPEVSLLTLRTKASPIPMPPAAAQ